MAKNLLKVWMADNTVTTDDKTDKIFVLESTRSVDQQFVLDRMAAKNPGKYQPLSRSYLRTGDEWI